MNIGMILDNEFHGDLRVENEVSTLMDQGFKVTILCFDHKNKKPKESSFNNATVVKKYLPLFYKNKMKGLTNFIIDPYTLYWSRMINSFISSHEIDVLHVHDLYLLGAAFKANKRINNKKIIVADLHENYPAALKYYKFSNKFPGNVLISIPKWERTEKKWINEADYIITVIEEAKSRYQNLGAKNVFVVANYVNRNTFKNNKTEEASINSNNSSFKALYVGGFDSHRGIECAIKSVKIVINRIPNFELVLVGAGSNQQELIELVKKLDISKYVSFEGWQSPTILPDYISNSDICLIPHLKTEHTDHTIPHKLFQYMFMKKPVISTDCTPIERILEESNAGLIYTSNNEMELADRIIDLYSNPAKRDMLGENGHAAVIDKYNWQKTSNTLLNLYKEINELSLMR